MSLLNKPFFKTIAAGLFLFPTFVSAQTLVNIGVDPNADFSGFLNQLYAIAIAVAALLAVLKIVIAGVKYMTTDIVTSKGDAKRDIQGAVVGLLIVMAAFLILNVINPAITGGSIGGNLTQLQAPAVATSGPAAIVAPVVTDTHYTSIPASDPGRATFEANCASGLTGTYMGRIRCYTSAPPGTNTVRIIRYTCTGFNPLAGCTSIVTSTAEDSCDAITGATRVPGSTPAPSGANPGNPGYLICYIP